MIPDSDSSFSRYKRRFDSYPRLSGEQERTLYWAWRNEKDTIARDKILHSNLRHVFAIAVKYRGYPVPIDELFAEGALGMMRALEKFEPDRNNRFVTYMQFWVRAYILNYILRNWSLVRDPARRSKEFFKLRRAYARFSNLGSREESEKLTAELVGMSTAKTHSVLQSIEARDVSLCSERYPGCDNGSTIIDTLLDPHPNQYEQLHTHHEVFSDNALVRAGIGVLDPRERYIVENRFMADDPMSLAEVGRHLGCSRERARQLEARALKKLRAHFIRGQSVGMRT